MIKRKIDKMLTGGNGRQLLWLIGFTVAVLIAALVVLKIFYRDGTLVWQDIVALFIDPGCFSGAGSHDWFRLIVALMGTFLFSALLISVFTNLFENISEDVRSGKRRYCNLKNHILILGDGHRLQGVINALQGSGHTIVVMSDKEQLMDSDCIFYQGCSYSEEDLQSTNAHRCFAIYIIGNGDESGKDAKSLLTLQILKKICKSAEHKIHCYLSVSDFLTTEVLLYQKQNEVENNLLIDIVNEYECQAEELLIGTDFLPVIRSDDKQRSHIIIIGNSEMSKAVAYTAAHISHYPNFTTHNVRTCITIISNDIKEWSENFINSRPGLFELSRYTYISEEGDKKHIPSKDFLDIEWQFVSESEHSLLAHSIIEKSLKEDITSIVVCHKDYDQAVNSILHLPRDAYHKAHLAVWLEHSLELIERSKQTGMYGNIYIFGTALGFSSDPLYICRTTRGKRVNYLYYKEYVNKNCADMEEAWYSISETDKHSSIYCANAMPLRKLCFSANFDMMQLYEVEHRRWMMSVLLMGFYTGDKRDKKKFVHSDIIQFDDLTKEEKDKDKLLIDAMEYIING